MPECVECPAPVARHGTICTECDLEAAFGTGAYGEEGDDGGD